MSYEDGHKIHVAAVVHDGYAVIGSGAFQQIKIPLENCAVVWASPRKPKIGDSVTINAGAYVGMTFTLIGIDQHRAWVRQHGGGGKRFEINYNDLVFHSVESVSV